MMLSFQKVNAFSFIATKTPKHKERLELRGFAPNWNNGMME